MIRRGFWLLLGAALGVAGYRRAGRLARTLRPGFAAARQPAARRRPASPPGGGAAAFLRDVRDGRDEYLDRHLRPAGPTLEGQQVSRRHQAAAGARAAARGITYAKDGH